VTASFEIGADEGVVVDLAIEDEPRALVATVHWLMARGGEIDDRESTKAEAAAMIIEDQIAGVIRSTMSHLIAHARQQRRLN
jgi:hypothetical protein